METTKIYASYGVLGHEYENVWGVAPADTPAYDEVTVKLPDGYSFEESVSEETLVVADDGTTELLARVLAPVTRREEGPFLRFPSEETWRKVPLAVVEDQS